MSGRTSLSSGSVGQQNWLECAKWLNDCGALNEQLRTRLKTNTLTISDLAYGLRDGVVLCNLLNILAPGSIDSSQIQRRTQSRLACIKNIKLFLETCKKEFSLTDQHLFQAVMLYDLDIECVILALSTISKLKQVEQTCGRPGFNINSNQSEIDIYYNIQPVEDADSVYTPDIAILHSEENDSIYQTIMHSGSGSEESKKTPQINLSKRDHVTREIYDSEVRYVKTLQTIINDFMKQLTTILNDKDKKIIFINIESLKELHSELLEKLRDAIIGGHGRTIRICEVYDQYKQKMMRDYVDYFGGMQTAISKVDNLNVKSAEFRNKLEECRKKSDMGTFKLSDLIRIPYQRVLKYHLLFNELNKQTDEQHKAKKNIQHTLANMTDLAHYLNEAQRDKEVLDQIDDINNHIQDFHSTNLKDFGHLVKDDNVRIKEIGDRFAKYRTLLLFDKALFICKSRGDNYYYKGTLLLNEYKIEDSGFDSNNNNAVQFNLVHNNDRAKCYSFYCKDDKQKNEWRTCILNAIDKLQPRGYNNQNHNFVLFNFDREIVSCSLCKKVLLGVLFQGYKCNKCSSLAHKSCILKFTQCTGGSSSQRTTSSSTIGAIPQLQHQTSTTSTTSNRPSMSGEAANKRLTRAFVPYRVRALYTYQGRPLPPDANNDCPALKFKTGDVIQVTDDDDDDWWKGYKVSAGGANGVEGCFPKSYVQAIENYINKTVSLSFDSTTTPVNDTITNEVRNIEQYSWYASCERDAADTILSRIPNPGDVTLFLVRPRQEGGYAISIRYNSKVEHIRIHVLKFHTTDGKETANVCLVEQTQFPSIQELIAHYMETRLEDNFPQLKTTLGVPFRDALPKPISEAIALHDYDPRRMSTGVEIELTKDNRYWVLSKEAMGWWKVYNNVGLIGYAPGNYLREL